MAIAYSTLLEAAELRSERVVESFEEAIRRRLKTAFLCHSHADKRLVEGFVQYVARLGWDVYIDWKDTSMPPSPNRLTAKRIKTKIKTSDLFIFLATNNSVRSRWCPWEIGFGDAAKFGNEILVVTTTDSGGAFYGNEYLQLYRHLDVAVRGGFGFSDPGQAGWVPVSAL